MEDGVDLEGSKQSNIESSEPSGARSSAAKTSDSTASAAIPSAAAVPCRRVTPAGMQRTLVATLVRGAVMEESSDTPVKGATSAYALCKMTGVSTSGGKASPGASVEA